MTSGPTTPNMELALPARAENIAIVRHAFGALGEALAIDEEVVSDIRLAVTEAWLSMPIRTTTRGRSRSWRR
jgi:serine/threonine-protein kinase RsbW